MVFMVERLRIRSRGSLNRNVHLNVLRSFINVSQETMKAPSSEDKEGVCMRFLKRKVYKVLEDLWKRSRTSSWFSISEIG